MWFYHHYETGTVNTIYISYFMWLQPPVEGEALKLAAHTFDGNNTPDFILSPSITSCAFGRIQNEIQKHSSRWMLSWCIRDGGSQYFGSENIKVLGTQASTLFTRVYDAH